MPWVRENDEDVYKASLYAKEELPTWDELYSEFYKKKIFKYDPNVEHEKDPYWKINRDLVIMATCCNQLNKLMFEDGHRDEVIEMINQYKAAKSENGMHCTDVRFLFDSGFLPYNGSAKNFKIGTDACPPIFTFLNPSGEQSIFITNDHPRVIVSGWAFPSSLYVAMYMYFVRDDDNDDIYIDTFVDRASGNDEDFNMVVDHLLAPVIKYYEDEDHPGFEDIEKVQLQLTCEQ